MDLVIGRAVHLSDTPTPDYSLPPSERPVTPRSEPQRVEVSKKDFEKGDIIVHEQTGQRFRVTSTSPFTIQRIP